MVQGIYQHLKPLKAESTIMSAMDPMVNPATEIDVMMLLAFRFFRVKKYRFAMYRLRFMQ